jgi:hypothetical protein
VNKVSLDRYRPELRKVSYDAPTYKSYLDQLGVTYPPPMPEKGVNVQSPQ